MAEVFNLPPQTPIVPRLKLNTDVNERTPTEGADAPPVVPYFDPEGQTISSVPTEDKVNDFKVEPKPTILQGLTAGQRDTLWVAVAQNIYDDSIYTKYDPDFKVDQYLASVRGRMPDLTVEEERKILTANTLEHADAMLARVKERRYNQAVMGQRPIASVIGSLADADLLVGGAAKVLKIPRLVAAVGAGGAVVGTYEHYGANLLRDHDVSDAVVFALSAGLYGGSTKAANGVTNTPVAVEPAPYTYIPTAPLPSGVLTPNMQNSMNNLGVTLSNSKAVRGENNLTDAELDAGKATGKNVSTSYIGKALQNSDLYNRFVSTFTSHADHVAFLLGTKQESLVNQLFKNTATRDGTDVVSRQTYYTNDLGGRILPFEKALAELVQVRGYSSNVLSRINGKFREGFLEVSREVAEAQQKLDQMVMRQYDASKVVPTRAEIDQMMNVMGVDADVQKVLKSYMDSGLAERAFDHAKSSGAFTKTVIENGVTKEVDLMDELVRRPTYFPIKQSYSNMESVVASGKATMKEIEMLVGRQIGDMYPDLLKPIGKGGFKLTESQLGNHFIQTQRTAERGSQVSATGFTEEGFVELFKTVGVSDADAFELANRAISEQATKGSGVHKNIRKRIAWDYFDTLDTASGYRLSMSDIISPNVLDHLDDYSRSMGSRFGLADYGIKSEAELRKEFEVLLDMRPKDVSVRSTNDFINESVNMLMGRAPMNSAELPAFVRGSKSLADVFLLGASGILSIMEVVTTVQQLGLFRTMPHIFSGLKTAITPLKGLDVNSVKDIEHVFTQAALREGAWRPFISRYSDNFAVGSAAAEAAEYYGQSARFMNISETIKRFQVGMMSGVYAKNLEKAMSGNAADLKFMRNDLKLSPELISRMKTEFTKHGSDVDSWSAKTRADYMTKVFHDADRLAMNIRTGELPTMMNNMVMRTILPYMSFVFAATQKVFRAVDRRDGHLGMALLLTVQLPTAVMIASLKNISQGKEPDEDLAKGTLAAISGFGALNYAAELAMSGVSNMGVTALAPWSKAHDFGNEIITGGANDNVDPQVLLNNSPLNSNVIIKLLARAFLEDAPAPVRDDKEEESWLKRM